jgi:acyl carrier protein
MTMLDVRSDSMMGPITAIVRNFIKYTDAEIPVTQDLQELGLTSFEMVNMMLAIEAEFDLTIPASKLIPANFRTIENIETLVRGLIH